ncbi:MAG: MFS transporter [Lachnospiraceae bacterium]|nr:MFS transporter [Lachnospiraceae bacterium]
MKNETAAKMQKRHEREEKELARLTKLKNMPSRFHGFWFLLVILTVIYVADEISSTINGTMKTYMIFDLFKIPKMNVDSSEYAKAISLMGIATIPTYFITAINPLYKTLADKLGRKIFLVINTAGMGLGLLLCMIAPNVYVFIVGTCVTGFFTPNDMQVIYLMETAPKEHRAKLCSITKGIGLLSVSLIGILRGVFYNPDSPETWRLVYIVPVLIAFIIAAFAFIFTKETPVFLDKRIAYLKKTDEEREEEAKKKAAGAQQGSLKEAARYIFTNKQCRMILIVILIFSVAVAMTGYVQEILIDGGVDNAGIDTFLFVEPIVYAVCALFSGFLTDAIGRKKSGFVFGIIAVIGMMAFVIGAKAGLPVIILAFANGIMFGGLWSFSDLMYLTLPAESAPTHIRASVMSLLSYAYITNMIATTLVSVFYTKIGSSNIGIFQLIFFVPIMLFSATFLLIKVKETKNTDLEKIGEEEE